MAEELIEILNKIFPEKSGKFKVMIAGTFDILHTGHLCGYGTHESIFRCFYDRYLSE